MGTRRLVSIIVIFFNARQFIEQAIESIFAQTYDRWELLLVDDGATDGSTEVALVCARDFPNKVRYLTHESRSNRGMSASRNLGVRHARGDLLAFLDADDVWYPDKLERQIEILERHPRAGMVTGATLHWYSWTGRAGDAKRDRIALPSEPRDRLVEPPALALQLRPLGNGLPFSNSGTMLRREVIDRVGGYEDRFPGLFEDQAFLTKVYLSTPVYVASACWDCYRQHAQSCCARAKAAGARPALRRQFLLWLEGYLRSAGLEGTPIWRALQHALLEYRRPARYWLHECRQRPMQVLRRCIGGPLRHVLSSRIPFQHSLRQATLPDPSIANRPSCTPAEPDNVRSR
jgi:glycosyltransferase involved in cell wall biosynthesis